ncbi:cytochrome P450 [Streptomyces sp. NPDC058783]|uniref:cytochrome P450 n=1 Tax=Streptomyces TaxID=1883 RepID=UPI0021089386|nr:cytochrome P450 [Streptomyces coelicoflavus]MCQ4200092.1 cytochrome P450 [Streptomyces coelicoflavus]
MTVSEAVPLTIEDFSDVEALESRLGRRHGCVPILLPDGMPAWLVLGNAEMRQALSHPGLVRSASAANEALTPYLTLANSDFPLSRHLLFADQPDHGRMKESVKDAFNRGRVEKLRPWMTDLAHGLVDAFVEAGEADFVPAFALPFPIAVISEVLGVEEDRRADFEARAAVITGVNTSANGSDIAAAGAWFDTFAGELLASRRAEPRDDVMTTMAQAVDTGRMTEREARSNAFLFLSAGFETTVNLLANGLLALLRHPEQLRIFREDGSRDGTLRALEEMLRYDSAVSGITYRFAAEDLTLAGVRIPKGDHVAICLPSANHDERVVECPAHFDVRRTVNPHLSFGHSTHFCLGAPLARLEGEIALRVTVDRLADLELAVPEKELTWEPSFTVHRLSRLPVRFRPASRRDGRAAR